MKPFITEGEMSLNGNFTAKELLEYVNTEEKLFLLGPYIASTINNSNWRKQIGYHQNPMLRMLLDCAFLTQIGQVMNKLSYRDIKKCITDVSSELPYPTPEPIKREVDTVGKVAIVLMNRIKKIQIEEKATELKISEHISGVYQIQKDGGYAAPDNVSDRYDIGNKDICELYLNALKDGKVAMENLMSELLYNNTEEIIINYNYIFNPIKNEHKIPPITKKLSLPSELLRLLTPHHNCKSAILYNTLAYSYWCIENKEDIDYIVNAMEKLRKNMMSEELDVTQAFESFYRFELPSEPVLDKFIKERERMDKVILSMK